MDWKNWGLKKNFFLNLINLYDAFPMKKGTEQHFKNGMKQTNSFLVICLASDGTISLEAAAT